MWEIMKKKILKRVWERVAAVSLSLILAVGMLISGGTAEAEAADSISVSIDITIEELEGAEMLDIQGLAIEAHKAGSSMGTDVAEFEIAMDDITQSRAGNCVTYTCTIEDGPYRLLDFFIVQNGKRVWAASIGDEGNDAYVISNGSRGTGKLCRFRFMNGNTVWYEQYASFSRMGMPFLQLSATPQKTDHTFLGWTKDEGSSNVWDFDNMGTVLRVPTTFYAVWEHPAEDTWAWNSDNDSHWRECSCKELKTAEEAHTWDGGIITRQPTDTTEGEKTYTCAGCGRTKTEPVPATGKPTVGGNDSISGHDPTLPDNPSTPGNSDTPANAPDTGTNNVNTGNNGISVKAVANAKTTSAKNKEPKTGGAPYIEIYATVAMIAGMAYLLLYFSDDKRGMSEAEKKELMSKLITWAKKGGYFRRILALAAIFFLLCYYHSIGKQSRAQWEIT